MSENTPEIYNGGVPTAPDVQKLKTHYPEDEMYPGFEIKYKDIEKLINSNIRSNRFKTVTKKWRRYLEDEKGLVLGVLPGVAFIVLNDNEKLSLSVSKLKTAGTFAGRSKEIAMLVNCEKINGDERRRLDAVNRAAKDISLAARINLIMKPLKEATEELRSVKRQKVNDPA